MTFTIPEPQRTTIDVDDLFITAAATSVTSNFGKLLIDNCWHIGLEDNQSTINMPSASKYDADCVHTVIRFFAELPSRNITWSWTGRPINDVTAARGTITIWSYGDQVTRSPLYVSASLRIQRFPNGRIVVRPADIGTMIIGNSSSYHVMTYTGMLISELAARLIPELTQRDFITAQTTIVPTWKTRAFTTLCTLVANVPTFVPDVSVETMAGLTEVISRVSRSTTQTAATIIESLPLDLVSAIDGDYVDYGNVGPSLADWFRSGGDPRDYQDVIARCVPKNGTLPLAETIAHTALSTLASSERESVSAIPDVSEVFANWHANNIIRITTPVIRQRLITLMTETAEAVKQVRPDLLITMIDHPSDGITWSDAVSIATTIEAQISASRGYVQLSLTRHAEELSQLASVLRAWPHHQPASEIDRMTNLRLNLIGQAC